MWRFLAWNCNNTNKEEFLLMFHANNIFPSFFFSPFFFFFLLSGLVCPSHLPTGWTRAPQVLYRQNWLWHSRHWRSAFSCSNCPHLIYWQKKNLKDNKSVFTVFFFTGLPCDGPSVLQHEHHLPSGWDSGQGGVPTDAGAQSWSHGSGVQKPPEQTGNHVLVMWTPDPPSPSQHSCLQPRP